MNLEYLKSFYWIAKCNSISKASKKLHISQPALSNQLNRLEDELGSSLLKRSNKGVLLTATGEIVFDYSKSIFALEENMHNSIEELDKLKDLLSIAVCKSFGSSYFASKIHNFKDINGKAQIKIDTYNSSDVINKVLNHDYNIGIILNQLPLDNVEQLEFFNDELLLFTNKDYPYDSIDIKELSKIPMIIREKQSAMYKMLYNFARANDLDIDNFNILFSTNCVSITKSSVINGCGFTFFPKSSMYIELQNNLLKQVHINNAKRKDFLSYKYSVIKRSKYELNYYEKRLKEFLLEV